MDLEEKKPMYEDEKKTMSEGMIEFLTKIGYFKAEVYVSDGVSYINLPPIQPNDTSLHFCKDCKLRRKNCECGDVKQS
jgi:hypothetical protein